MTETEYYPKWDQKTSWLDRFAVHYGTDKAESAHGYTKYYEQHLDYLKNRPCTILEIGILTGASLRMWHNYFVAAKIIGIDVSPPINNLPQEQLIKNGGRIEVVLTDIKHYQPTEPLDVVIDDGSHQAEDILIAFDLLWPAVKPGGWYIIEDWNTQSDHTRAEQFGPFGATTFTKNLLDCWAESIAMDDEEGYPLVKAKELHVYPEITFLRKK